MCGIAGIISVGQAPVPGLEGRLAVMNRLQAHRGPDGEGVWTRPAGGVGLAHRRLSIIDLSSAAAQPMTDGEGNWVVFNGEIYNYVELREELGVERFRTASDTETILQAYRHWGVDCMNHLRGMFAFALWDEKNRSLLCARDRFGIKPFYYAQSGGALYFASEVKALLPFLPAIETDTQGLKEYLSFQFCLAGRTLFKDVHELPAGHRLVVKHDSVRVQQYWEVFYVPEFGREAPHFEGRLRERLGESVRLHLRSDVPLGAYLSGGFDSSVVSALAARGGGGGLVGFTGKFAGGPLFDESPYAREMARAAGMEHHEIEIGPADFTENIRRVIYYMDFPAAGPGVFPQFMVSGLAARHRKVVLGGQGGDEVFGGYARYLIAYFEQCIKGAIDGTLRSGNFVVTYESIIPNLATLREYKPLLQEFWSDGLFEPMDRRYFRLINRAPMLGDLVRWDRLGPYDPFEMFQEIFNATNVGKQSYFDLMTHFDFKTLLPALLQVEDRVSMAHGLESRIPLLDHPVVELAATIPADVKFRHGDLKHCFKNAFGDLLPASIMNRKNKMGFPVPLTEWMQGPVRDFVMDVFSSRRSLERDWVDNGRVRTLIDREKRFGRNIWGLLCLELWQQEFHDRQAQFHQLSAKGGTDL